MAPPADDQPRRPPYGDQQPPLDPPQSPYRQQPNYGQPRHGQPRHGQHRHGQPQYRQPDYGQPQYGQPQYDQPQYDQPQPPYGSPPYGAGGSYPPPPKQGNGFAIAGIILAIFVPILGLIFSIIGLTKSRARAGAGKALSVAGIVVSVIVIGGAAAVIAIVSKSTAADPGCVSAESSANQMNSTLTSDEAALTRDASNTSTLQADLQHFLTDLRTWQQRTTAAETQAQHQSVKAQIATLISDIRTFTASVQAIAQGNTSQVGQLQTAASKLQSDAHALDSTCTSL